MGMKQTISVSLKDHVNQSAIMGYVHERSFLEALANFFGFTTTTADELKTFAETYSNAKVVKCATNNANDYQLPDGYLGSVGVDKGFDVVDHKAVCTFRDASTGAAHTVSIPAAKSSLFIEVLGGGYRVDPVQGAQMAADLSAIVGNTLIFQEGWHVGKK